MTVGYRSSLTEIVHLIGHTTRDAPGKSRARFTNLIAEPGASEGAVTEAVNDTLKALLPYYAGQVKCIYIAPPYNTGNEGWVYNDNFNAPAINAWPGKVVGKEATATSRRILTRTMLIGACLCE